MNGILRPAHTALISRASEMAFSSLSMTQGPAMTKRGLVPPAVTPLAISTALVPLEAIGMACSDKRFEERMRTHRLGLELRMELAAEEPGMVLDLDDLDEGGLGVGAGERQAGLGQFILVGGREFVE